MNPYPIFNFSGILLVLFLGVLLYFALNYRKRKYLEIERERMQRDLLNTTQTKLQIIENRYKDIFDFAPVGIIQVSWDGKILMSNLAIAKMLKYESVDEFNKVNAVDLYYDKDDRKKLFTALNENGRTFSDIKFNRKDSTPIWLQLSSHVVKDSSGKIEFIESFVSDISERKENEEKLENYKNHLENLVRERTENLDQLNLLLSNENKKLKIARRRSKEQLNFLQSLIDTIPSPIFFQDSKKLFLGCNKAFEKLHRVSREEMMGKNPYSLFSPEEALFLDAKDEELFTGSGEIVFEFTTKDNNGNELNIISHKAIYKTADGKTGAIVGVLLDVTEMKRLEKEITIALQQEKEWSELKSRFITSASHEFKTPLTSILSSADLLEMYGDSLPPEKFKKYVSIIQNSVEYMTALTNDVLNISRAENNNIIFNPVLSDLKNIIGNLIENEKLSAPENIHIHFEYYPEEIIFNVDDKLLTQIISNLLSNAIKYSPGGGNVIITVKSENNFLLISVSDEGIGIPEENIEHLFEPFYRGANVQHIPGTGLGLSIVSRTTELHKGKIEIESKLNKGTKVTVIISLD